MSSKVPKPAAGKAQYATLLIFVAVFAAGFIVSFIWNAREAVSIIWLRNTGGSAIGVVVDNVGRGRNRPSDAVVAFSVDGTEFRQRLLPSDWGARLGDIVTVFYDPADPSRVTTGRVSFLIIAIFALKIIFLIWGCVYGIRPILRARRRVSLR